MMRTATLERPGLQLPAMPIAPAMRPQTRLVGRWQPDRRNPNQLMLTWVSEDA